MQNLIALGQKYHMQNYKPLPLLVDHGEGAWLFDKEGKGFIDFVAGVAVSSLGYGDKDVLRAITEQASKVIHTSNLLWNEPSILLAKALIEASFADRVFFCNSGAEANEAMLKMARKVFYDKGEDRPEIICMDKAFHGRTLGTISSTGQIKHKTGFGGMVPGFTVVPFGDIEALRKAVSPKTAAIILEPILGEGGVLVPPKGYLRQVRELCDSNGSLMLLDEVQSGMGRTGELFAYQHDSVVPDAMTLAKGLGGGMPIGALLAKEEYAKALAFGTHGSTFGGNAVCCAAALAVFHKINQPQFLHHVREIGDLLERRLRLMLQKFSHKIKNVRGVGLWFGVELSYDAGNIRELALAKGLIINLCGTNVLRIAPPLVIDRVTLEDGLNRLEEVFTQWNE